MTVTQAQVGEALAPDAHADAQVAPLHWSLTPASWPGLDTAASHPARAWRTRARLQVLPAWRERLKLLSHHDPDYAYDPGYEYQEDWTTDADYRRDGVRLYCFDGAGRLVMPTGSFHGQVIEWLLQTLCRVLGHRVCKEPDLHYAASVSKALQQFTEAGEPRTLKAPDLVVMPPSWTLAEPRERTVEERIIRLDRGDPLPELVAELVSKSNRGKDFDDNLDLYAALGISEYLIVDTGEFTQTPGLWLFRLKASGNTYHLAESGRTLTACGIPMRMRDADVAGNAPVVQCRDPETGRWHDHENDLRLEGRMDTLVCQLGQLPGMTDRDLRHAEHQWRQNGLPDNAEELLMEAARKPAQWRELLNFPA